MVRFERREIWFGSDSVRSVQSVVLLDVGGRSFDHGVHGIHGVGGSEVAACGGMLEAVMHFAGRVRQDR